MISGKNQKMKSKLKPIFVERMKLLLGENDFEKYLRIIREAKVQE